ncbi:OmpH family outer membrane protein [Aliiglaciecola sp. CAU 1673]|uniref:OmpH family outer membrane protein n=1 Tax=Aliiglaciecola sp. CAU 1673 TaxID=3032595 RepID=UPI0023DA9BC0|nr:OmpH family outer membrane protein [Aliiglaciecola sp. CAU 1673]MDF2179616.1 OmpH family outer membrane protein [Aliiglaciecola sp. CAU 1673]
MNTFKKSALNAAILGTALFGSAAIAAEKIAVVNVQGVFQSLPQAAMIQENIRAEFKDQIEEAQRLEKDMKYYLEKQQRDAATMSEKERKELEEKLISLRNDFAAKAQPLQNNMQRRGAEERNKLLGKIKDSIDAIAAKDKYDLVLNAEAVLFLKDESKDISKQIIDQVSKSN